jgi:hypothetical protein
MMFFDVQDEVLEDMQQKLDDLLVEMNSLQQHYVKCDSYISTERGKYEIVGSKNIGDEEGSRCVRARPDAAPTPQKAKVQPIYLFLLKKRTCSLKSMHQLYRISVGRMMLGAMSLIDLVYLSWIMKSAVCQTSQTSAGVLYHQLITK